MNDRPFSPLTATHTAGSVAHAHDHATTFQQEHGVQIYLGGTQGDNLGTAITTARLASLNFWPLVSENTDPVKWGVHPAPTREDSRHVEYVGRDVDENIVQAIKPGCFLLLVGDSTAGKSRTAFEAAQRLLGDYRVFMPFDGSETAIASELMKHDARLLLWLDDLDVFLAPPAVSVRTIDEIAEKNGVVLATIRAERYNELSLREDRSAFNAERLLVRNARQIMSRASKFFLDRRWSAEEIDRAQTSSDPRMADALSHADEYGVAEYLAAGPQLYEEWRNAWAPGGHPRAAALVASAIDFKRAGISRPVGVGELLKAHEYYLEQNGGIRLRPESFEQAISWATDPLHATTSLLVPYEAGTYKAFDYLVDKVANSETLKEIPDIIWDEVLSGKWDFDFHTVGEYAAKTGRTDLAEKAYRIAEDSDSEGRGAFRLGHVFDTAGEYDQAEAWYERSANSGNVRALVNLGYLYMRKNDSAQAEKFLQVAVQKGEEKAALGLTVILLHQNRIDEADTWCLFAEEKGLKPAKILRADICMAKGNIDQAEKAYQESMATFPGRAAAGLGLVHLRRKEFSQAISHFQVAAHKNDHNALRSMAYCYSELRNHDKAQELSRQYIKEHPDHAVAYFDLGLYLSRANNVTEAESAYRKAIELGDNRAITNLANLLSNAERYDEAEELYLSALEKQDGKARSGLAHLYRLTGRFSAAIRMLRDLVREGHQAAYKEMGRVQEDLGRTNLAILWLQKAVDLGDKSAGVRLGYIYERRGEPKKATPYYRVAAEDGDGHAYLHLAMIFEYRGKIEKAKDLYRAAFAHDEFEAAARLGRLYWLEGNLSQSEEWCRKGAEKGDEEAKKCLEFLQEYLVESNGKSDSTPKET
ncbi:tetratricopeptide repeat protein [Streptomyces flaveolus]|uniref:tetratricopeptide repeat protein n=1 Tax=Streptomyces flaveolus TaxID=67297 RepID=UPI0037001119